ncbi:hypothetical protein N7488_008856 [Penicillium malachiteum]|nr:hypothetical protein N7488_008856 [Penicillium malachiteum]
MAWKVLPFQPPNTLRAQLPHIARQPSSHTSDDCKARRSIFFPMLGIGAITAGYAKLGNSGCFTSAYIRLGVMLPKILAAGMDNFDRTPQEQAIISAFCCHESFVCFALGREAVFSRSLRYLPKSDKTIIGLMQPFFSILAEIQELHKPEGMDVGELWSASRSLEDRLRKFWLLENPHHGSTFKDDIDMGTICE